MFAGLRGAQSGGKVALITGDDGTMVLWLMAAAGVVAAGLAVWQRRCHVGKDHRYYSSVSMGQRSPLGSATKTV